MNPKPPASPGSSIDDTIDAALRSISQADPRAGLEGRIMARLKSEEPRPRRFFLFQSVALKSVAAVLATGAILFGTIQHGRKPGFHPDVRLHAPAESGMSPAGAVRQPAQPLPQVVPGKGRPGRRGRAQVNPDSHRANGVAVPRSPRLPAADPADKSAPDQP